MREYYLVEFKYKNKKYFCIMFSDENLYDDQFLIKNNQIVFAKSKKEILRFCKENEYSIVNEVVYGFDLDAIIEFIDAENFQEIDYGMFYDFWNVIEDMANSLDIAFYGTGEGDLPTISNRLFWATNPPSLEFEKPYTPKWSENDILELKKVLKEGIEIVMKYVIKENI